MLSNLDSQCFEELTYSRIIYLIVNIIILNTQEDVKESIDRSDSNVYSIKKLIKLRRKKM